MRAVGRRRGRRHGAAMMVWMFFANLLDPRKAVAIERIEAQNRVGSEAARIARAAAAPPIAGGPRHGG